MPHKDPEVAKAYRASRRKQTNEIARRYRNRNLSRCRARERRYNETHRAARRLYGAKYRKEHADLVSASRNAYVQTEKGKETVRRGWRNRYARRKQMRRLPKGVALTQEQWLAILRLQKRRCYWCGKKMKKTTIDHVIPLSKGGLHRAENVVAACLACNAKKKDKIVTLF